MGKESLGLDLRGEWVSSTTSVGSAFRRAFFPHLPPQQVVDGLVGAVIAPLGEVDITAPRRKRACPPACRSPRPGPWATPSPPASPSRASSGPARRAGTHSRRAGGLPWLERGPLRQAEARLLPGRGLQDVPVEKPVPPHRRQPAGGAGSQHAETVNLTIMERGSQTVDGLGRRPGPAAGAVPELPSPGKGSARAGAVQQCPRAQRRNSAAGPGEITPTRGRRSGRAGAPERPGRGRGRCGPRSVRGFRRRCGQW